MRRASSLVGLPFDLTPGGLMADSGGFVLPMHRRVGSRVGRSSRIDTKDRKAGRRGRMSLNRRRFVTLVFVLAAAATLRIVAYLSLWYPGDETIRATSESWLKLMFSRSGVSFGTGRAIKFATDVRIDAGDAILTTKPGSVVQGKISQRPRWEKGKDLNVTAVAEIHLRDALEKNCFFRVRDDAPVVTLWDDGVVHEYELNGGVAKASDFGGGTAGDGSRGHDSPQKRLNVESLACSHFRCMSYASWSRLSEGRTPTPPPVTKDSQSGNVLLINSATTLKMLSEYHRPLLNHQAYAESHGYGYVLALVKPSDLQGRSGKFAKHLALGAQLAKQRSLGGGWDYRRGSSSRGDTQWDDTGGVGADATTPPPPPPTSFQSVCHMDLDAWFATWARFSTYGDRWGAEKDLLFGDAGQIWLNTGLLCARPSQWAVAFFTRVVNAAFSGVAPEDTEGVETERRLGRPVGADFDSGTLTGGSGAVTVEVTGREGTSSVDSRKYIYGFQRDQPAVWHVLAQTWATENGVPYKAQACDVWHRACNPVENPIECWHWCHWDALQRWGGSASPQNKESIHPSETRGKWTGGLAGSVHLLARVQLAPRFDAPAKDVDDFFAPKRAESKSTIQKITQQTPPMHRMCLRSCRSVLSRVGMGLCGAVSGGAAFCFPKDVDKMSLCDGAGCLKQMAVKGGGWIKHTGHQHWRDTLPSCVPVTEDEVARERADPKKACA